MLSKFYEEDARRTIPTKDTVQGAHLPEVSARNASFSRLPSDDANRAKR